MTGEWTEAEAAAFIGQRVRLVTTEIVEIVAIEPCEGGWCCVVPFSEAEDWLIYKSTYGEEWHIPDDRGARH